MAQARGPAQLTPDQIQIGAQRLRKVLAEVRAFSPAKVTDQYNVPEIPRLSAAIDEALVRTFGANTLDYERYRRATDLARRITVGPPLAIEQVRAEFARVRARSIGLLEQAISGLDAELVEFVAATEAVKPSMQPKHSSPAKADLLTLKPTLWGIGIDLKEAWRRVRDWWDHR
jgi:hypothetical protein